MLRVASNVPLVSKPIAVITAFVNLILPGLGTLIAACCTESYAVSKTQLCYAFLQLVLSFIIIGWIFAQIWSYLIIKKAFQSK